MKPWQPRTQQEASNRCGVVGRSCPASVHLTPRRSRDRMSRVLAVSGSKVTNAVRDGEESGVGGGHHPPKKSCSGWDKPQHHTSAYVLGLGAETSPRLPAWESLASCRRTGQSSFVSSGMPKRAQLIVSQPFETLFQLKMNLQLLLQRASPFPSPPIDGPCSFSSSDSKTSRG